MPRALRLAFFLLASLIPVSSCIKLDFSPEFKNDQEKTRFYVNFFGKNVLKTYYLWTDEISDALEGWDMTAEPEAQVREARYKAGDGSDIDRWTAMYENISDLNSTLTGVSTTYGFEYKLYYEDDSQQSVVPVVTIVYPDSPASEAGLSRGDVIGLVNGRRLTPDNYREIVTSELMGSVSCSLTLMDDRAVRMTAVNMYEDPVLIYKTFNIAGKVVGYLHYTSFTLKSYERLQEAFRFFKSEGIRELILDLRYNGGGYVTAEYTLASMIAPPKAVEANEVFEKTIYNSTLMKSIGKTDDLLTTSFSAEIDGKTVKYSTVGLNPGITKLYAIIDSGSASASESILVGLMPYIDVELIGRQSHGKYCSGIVYPASDWYEDYKKALPSSTYSNGKTCSGDWGIYVMIGRYADKNGNTPCMPDGFVPDVEVADDPLDGHQLGDPEETMLSAALARAGYVPAMKMKKASAAPSAVALEFDERLAPVSFGMRVVQIPEL